LTQSTERVAIVTGAQQGIGAATALALAKAGYHIVLNYLDDHEAARNLESKLVTLGRRVRLCRGDVRDDATLHQLNSAAQEIGVFSVLINNAAIFPRASFLELEEQQWDDVLGVNLRAVFKLTQQAARYWVQNSLAGAVVNVTSSAAYRSSPRGAHYVSAKAGIVGLTRAAALELAEHQIRVNAVAPGLTDTAQPRFGMTEDEIADTSAAVPLGQMCTADDIAAAIQFLCSDAAKQITGQVLHVNGGQYLG
jgi:NAD(P)-dependent dehydrogenase (short-subunit alcohol dehydrogenase family)